MPDTKPVEDKTHLTFNQASEYYVDAFEKGQFAGALAEKDRIIKALLNPDFHDEVDKTWRGDMPIYDAIVKVLKNQR